MPIKIIHKIIEVRHYPPGWGHFERQVLKIPTKISSCSGPAMDRLSNNYIQSKGQV
jgi:hypothetical protein